MNQPMTIFSFLFSILHLLMNDSISCLGLSLIKLAYQASHPLKRNKVKVPLLVYDQYFSTRNSRFYFAGIFGQSPIHGYSIRCVKDN